MAAEASIHSHTSARTFAFQFLYRCQQEKIFFFQTHAFASFVDHFQVPGDARAFCEWLVEGTLRDLPKWDDLIRGVSRNWSVERMNATDLCVLRMACFEMTSGKTPRNVVMNEAIDLAKNLAIRNLALL